MIKKKKTLVGASKSGDSSFPGSQMTIISLNSHMEKRVRVSFYEGIRPINEGFTLEWSHFLLSSPRRFGISTYEF
jgi:hypothetical protein